MPKGRPSVPRFEKPCGSCGQTMFLREKELARKFCSIECNANDKRTGRTPNRICKWCSKPFYGKPHHIEAGYAHWCSQRCMNKSGWIERTRERNQDRAGTKNPNFKHGKKIGKNVSGWGISKKPGPCRSCGGPGEHLHHAVPRSKAQQAKRDLRNGIQLCASCHQRWHMGAVIRREVFTQEEWDYISSIELTGERIEEWLDRRYPSAASIAALALDVA